MGRKIHYKHDCVYSEENEEFRISSVTGKLGDVYFRLVYKDALGYNQAFQFSKLSSLLDFLTSNFDFMICAEIDTDTQVVRKLDDHDRDFIRALFEHLHGTSLN